MAKVRALSTVHQQLGTLTIIRLKGTTFDLPDEEIETATAAGLVESLVPAKKPRRAPPRMETK